MSGFERRFRYIGQEGRVPISNAGDHKSGRTSVIVPGGPRVVDQTHFVPLEHSVRQNPDGTLAIVPCTTIREPERSKTMADEMVLTPGGYRPRSKVHFIELQHRIKLVAEYFRVVSAVLSPLFDPLRGGE